MEAILRLKALENEWTAKVSFKQSDKVGKLSTLALK